MKTKLLMLLVLLGSLWTSNLYAQTRYPKREFRGAWIQCVNGQFQGMPTEKMRSAGEPVGQLAEKKLVSMPSFFR